MSRSFSRSRWGWWGRQTFGHDHEQAVEFSKLFGRQDRQRASHAFSPSAAYLGQKASAFVAEVAVNDAPVIGTMATDGQATALHAIDELGGGGVRHAQHGGKLADGKGPGLAEREQEPQLTERHIVVSPAGRPLSRQVEQHLNMSLDVVERNGMS